MILSTNSEIKKDEIASSHETKKSIYRVTQFSICYKATEWIARPRIFL